METKFTQRYRFIREGSEFQKRATKLVPALNDKSYEERLVALNLTTLETRRIRGDLIETFKILKGTDNIAANMFFTMSSIHNTRGHCLKLFLS